MGRDKFSLPPTSPRGKEKKDGIGMKQGPRNKMPPARDSGHADHETEGGTAGNESTKPKARRRRSGRPKE